MDRAPWSAQSAQAWSSRSLTKLTALTTQQVKATIPLIDERKMEDKCHHQPSRAGLNPYSSVTPVTAA